MKETIRQILKEDINKSDITKEFKKSLDGSDFKRKVEKIVLDRLKNEKMLDDKIVDITKNVLTQLYKQLWTKRAFWKSGLTNKKT